MKDDILLIVYQGETFNPPLVSYVDKTYTPIPLIGYTATFSIAQEPGDDILCQASSYNGQCIVNGQAGQIEINIPSLSLPEGFFEGWWDLFIYSPQGVATRLLGGRIKILESVTGGGDAPNY